MIDGVHGDAANFWPPPESPDATGASEHAVLPLGVTDAAESGPTRQQQTLRLSRGKTDAAADAVQVLSDEGCGSAGSADELCAAPRDAFNVVNGAAEGNFAQGQSGAVQGCVVGDNCAHNHPLRRQNVPHLSRPGTNQRHSAAPVRVVFDSLDAPTVLSAQIRPFRVDEADASSEPAAPVTHSDFAVVVAAAGLAQTDRVTGQGSWSRQGRVLGHAAASQPVCRQLQAARVHFDGRFQLRRPECGFQDR